MSYPVLAPVSEGYPKVKGRLLTCYSPVRRSSTPERAFPLDLHVLSTPPAFVLSQDQTLQQKTLKRKNPATNQMLPKKSQTGLNRPGKNKLGTGLSSTLLSSQRTTTHRKMTARSGDPLPGHSFNFTRSLWPCQPVSPGSYHSAPVDPASQS